MRPRSAMCAASFLLCAVFLSACLEASIGQDCADPGCEPSDSGAAAPDAQGSSGGNPCLGDGVTCVAPEHQEPQSWFGPPNIPAGPAQPGDAFARIEPLWVHPLAGVRPDFDISEIAGDGPTGLFFLGHDLSRSELLLGSFDADGTVAEQHVLSAPRFDDLPSAAREPARAEEVSLSYCTEAHTHGDGVVWPCYWKVPCDERVAARRCEALELISFSAQELAHPIRFFPEPLAEGTAAAWARAQSGETWEFRDGALRRYDRVGAVVVSQNVLEGLSPSHWPTTQAYVLRGPTLALGSDDSLSLYGYRDTGKAELWRFDRDGNPLHAIDLPYVEPTTLYADAYAGVRLFSISMWGDLIMRRAMPEGMDAGGHFLARKQYYDMYIQDVSRDGRDSFFVLTQSGFAREPTATLCEFPGSGRVRACYELGDGPLQGSLVGHGERVVFIAGAAGTEARSPLIARFELPR
jgi:hypothetical protein